jgi:glutaminase
MVRSAEILPLTALGPPRSPLERYLERLHDALSEVEAGQVASYIPELEAVDPDTFGLCIATPGGAVYQAGETRHRFTLQSISKPLTYGLALADAGVDAVRATVGVEPSGDAFNAISLDIESGLPVNPMINAGAIATVSLVADHGPGASRFERILETYSTYAGRRLDVDEPVYRSERATGHRNRAIAHLLRAGEVVHDEVEETVDAYFRQCAVELDCRDLAVIGATLANGGVNPSTGERALDAALVRHVLSVMTTCGMYDGAGEWLFTVGLPAKSGVSGGVLAVLPGRLGLAVYSPRLDPRGNSVRGVMACAAIARDFDVHLLDGGRPAVSPIRLSYTLVELASNRVRSPAEREALDAVGASCRVLELQGELELSAYERVSAAALEHGAEGTIVLLDLTRVSRVESGLEALLADLSLELQALGATLGVVAGSAARLVERVASTLPGGALCVDDDIDHALERCEDVLLAAAGALADSHLLPVRDHPVVARVAPAERDVLLDVLERRVLRPGETLVRAGEPSNALYLVTSGRLTVVRPDGTRAALLSAGMVVGELGVADGRERSADVVAETDVECHALALGDLHGLAVAAPAVHAAVLGALLEELTRIVRRLERELASLRPRPGGGGA